MYNQRSTLIAASIVTALAFSVVVFFANFQSFAKRQYKQPAYLDLFITEYFFSDTDASPWDRNVEKLVRPVEWKLNEQEFEKLDSVYVGFKNVSNEKFYYITWGYPNSRLRYDFIIYKNGIPVSIPFGGFGCGTGIHLKPIKNEKLAGSRILNPLLFHPQSNYGLPIKHDSFPTIFKKIYGDSIKIRFQQSTYSNPWNNFPSQMIYSDVISVSTSAVIDNWKKGLYADIPQADSSMEEFYGFKQMRPHPR